MAKVIIKRTTEEFATEYGRVKGMSRRELAEGIFDLMNELESDESQLPTDKESFVEEILHDGMEDCGISPMSYEMVLSMYMAFFSRPIDRRTGKWYVRGKKATRNQ